VTHLRQMMLDELQRRNYSQSTVRSYIHAMEDFSKYFRRPPDRLGPTISGSIKLICFVIVSFWRELSHRMSRPCAFLRQDSATSISDRSHSISQAPKTTAYRTEPGRSTATGRRRREPDAPGPAHRLISLLERFTSSGLDRRGWPDLFNTAMAWSGLATAWRWRRDRCR
jgi:hypothetical protein